MQKRQAEANLIDESAKFYCIPNNVTQGQVLDVIVKFLEDHPQNRHQNATVLISVALRDAFPCF